MQSNHTNHTPTAEDPLGQRGPRSPKPDTYLRLLRDLVDQYETLQVEMAQLSGMIRSAMGGSTCTLAVGAGSNQCIEMSSEMTVEFLRRLHTLKASVFAEVAEKLTRAQQAIS